MVMPEHPPGSRLGPTPRRTDYARPGRHKYFRTRQLYALNHRSRRRTHDPPQQNGGLNAHAVRQYCGHGFDHAPDSSFRNCSRCKSGRADASQSQPQMRSGQSKAASFIPALLKALDHAPALTSPRRSSSYLRITSKGSVQPTWMPTALATSRRMSHSRDASAGVGIVLGQPSVYGRCCGILASAASRRRVPAFATTTAWRSSSVSQCGATSPSQCVCWNGNVDAASKPTRSRYTAWFSAHLVAAARSRCELRTQKQHETREDP